MKIIKILLLLVSISIVVLLVTGVGIFSSIMVAIPLPRDVLSANKSVVTSPSGKASIQKGYIFLGGGEYGTKLFVKLKAKQEKDISFDKEPYMDSENQDGLLFAWPKEQLLIIGTPENFPKATGPAVIGDAKIKYVSYPVSETALIPAGGNTIHLKLGLTEFAERRWSEDFKYYGKPSKREFHECQLIILGTGDDNFKNVKLTVTSKGQESYTGTLYGTNISYSFEPNENNTEGLTPTFVQSPQAEALNYGKWAYMAYQSPHGITYSSRNPSEYNGLLEDAIHGKLSFRASFNFGEQIRNYKFIGKADAREIARFKSCDTANRQTGKVSS